METQLKLDEALAAVAVNQHSLITLANVLAAGGTKDHAKRRCQSGRWEYVHPGVYRLTGVPWTYEARLLAAVLAAGPGACVSHFCACRLHGFGFASASMEITLPRGRRCAIEGVKVHTSTDLARAKPFEISGIPVTDPDRTLLDVARKLRAGSLLKAIEVGRRTDAVTWQSLIACLASHARRGRPGVQRFREVIVAGASNDGITDTDSELIALSLIREHGLLEPVLQHRVFSIDGELVAKMDFAYLDQLLNIEIDGAVHLQPEVLRKSQARDSRLRRMRWTVERIWWEIPVYEPDEFVRIVRDLLRNTPPITSL